MSSRLESLQTHLEGFSIFNWTSLDKHSNQRLTSVHGQNINLEIAKMVSLNSCILLVKNTNFCASSAPLSNSINCNPTPVFHCKKYSSNLLNIFAFRFLHPSPRVSGLVHHKEEVQLGSWSVGGRL